MILTLTGPSGSGKTTIVSNLLAALPRVRIISSYTTRPPRDSDLPNEYIYLNQASFDEMKKQDLFLWTFEVHGFKYGTTRLSVERALWDQQAIYIMILVMDALDLLRAFAKAYDWQEGLKSYYILAPSAEVLRQRLEKRGDDEATISRRLADCAQWDAQARSSRIPLTFVRNDGSAQDAVDKIVNGILFYDLKSHC